jgi:hypothetical protein
MSATSRREVNQATAETDDFAEDEYGMVFRNVVRFPLHCMTLCLRRYNLLCIMFGRAHPFKGTPVTPFLHVRIIVNP